MTTATIGNKKVTLSIYEKAQLLSVFQVPGQAGYTVSSGSNAHKAYHVSEDASRCNCDSYTLCAHRIAAQNYKDEQARKQEEEETRRAYVRMFYSGI